MPAEDRVSIEPETGGSRKRGGSVSAMTFLLKTTRAVLFPVVLLLFLFGGVSFADIYRYVDKNGAVVLTDDPAKVPEEYRGQVSVIKEEGKGRPSGKGSKGEKDAGEGKGKTADGFQWEKLKESFKGFTKGKMLRPVLGVVLFLVLFFSVGRVCAILEQRRLGVILRIILTLGLVAYLSKLL